MAIRNIRQKDDEILKKKSKVVEIIDDKIKELAYDMLDTMYANDGVGLAACQVGFLKRIVTYDSTYIDDGTDKNPIVMINPEIINFSKSMIIVEEGCLSFPKEFENIKRHEKIKVKYLDLDGNEKIVSVKGIEAVVIQHECDHLDGIVFIDKVDKKK